MRNKHSPPTSDRRTISEYPNHHNYLKKERKMNYRIRRIYISCTALFTAVLLILSGCGGSTPEDVSSENTPEQISAPQQNTEDTFDPAAVDTVKAGKRSEMISVKAACDGTPEEISVSATLSEAENAEGKYIADPTPAFDLKNSRGEEDFHTADGVTYWEYLGKDISYEGKVDKELPVDVKVTYYLDGNEIDPESLKGRSGHVDIRFNYKNKEQTIIDEKGKTYSMYVPFIVLSMVPLDDDIFTNITINKGKIASLNGQKTAVGYTVLGLNEDLQLSSHEDMDDIDLPAEITVSADVTDFSLDFTATIVTSSIFSGDDEGDEEDDDKDSLDKFDDMIGDMDELEDASKDIVDASEKLYDGASQMRDGLSGYVDGAYALSNGITQLYNSVNQIDLSSVSGDPDISKNIADTMTALYTDAAALQQGIEALSAADPDAASLSPAVEDIKTQLDSLQNTLAGLSSMSQGLEGFTSSFSALQNGIKQLDDRGRSLASAGDGLLDGYDTLLDGISEFSEGIKKFDEEGIQELVSVVRDDLGEILNRFRALKNAGASYGAFTVNEDGQEGSAVFIIETREIE